MTKRSGILALLVASTLAANAAWAQDSESTASDPDSEIVDESAAPESYTEEDADAAEADDPFVRQLNAQLRGEEPAQGGSPLAGSQTAPLINLGRWVVSVSVVVALILALYALARRFGSRTPFLAGADLGHVIGRVYLSRQAVLYYVETGGRVLVIGVANNTISLVSEFDAAVFDEDAELPAESLPGSAAAFLSQLEESSRAMGGPRAMRGSAASSDDRDLSAMKSDLERMRRMLADEEEGALR